MYTLHLASAIKGQLERQLGSGQGRHARPTIMVVTDGHLNSHTVLSPAPAKPARWRTCESARVASSSTSVVDQLQVELVEALRGDHG